MKSLAPDRAEACARPGLRRARPPAPSANRSAGAPFGADRFTGGSLRNEISAHASGPLLPLNVNPCIVFPDRRMS